MRPAFSLAGVSKRNANMGDSYVFAPDRARHFANRTPDMRYLILDEELLDLEGYLDRLENYLSEYEAAVPHEGEPNWERDREGADS